METVLAETLPTVKVAILARAGLYKTGALRFPGMFLQWSAPILTVMFDCGLAFLVKAAVEADKATSFFCPVCSKRRQALYLREGQLACGRCNSVITAGAAARSKDTSPAVIDQLTRLILERVDFTKNNGEKPAFDWGYKI